MEQYNIGGPNDDLILWYKGVFEDTMTESLIELAESDVSESGIGKSKKKITLLMAESFQNIVRHGLTDQENEEEIPGAFGIINRSGEFHIFSANHIDIEQGESLNSKLKVVNDLNKEELREYYREVLSGGPLSEKGGAGLGLIEMARKSGSPLQYAFKAMGERSEFCLQIDKSLTDSEESSNLKIEESISMHDFMDEKGVLLFFKGDFDLESTSSMVRMLSGNASAEGGGKMDSFIFHAGVELLQNISRHGILTNGKTEGLFVMAVRGDDIILTTKNYIDPAKQTDFETHMNKLISNSAEELSAWYKKQLRASLKDDANNAGLGLIDVARISKGAMQYSFQNSSKGVQACIEVSINVAE